MIHHGDADFRPTIDAETISGEKEKNKKKEFLAGDRFHTIIVQLLFFPVWGILSLFLSVLKLYSIMPANVPLWVTCAVLSNALGLAFALTALARLGANPLERLFRFLCRCYASSSSKGDNKKGIAAGGASSTGGEQFGANGVKSRGAIDGDSGSKEGHELDAFEAAENGKQHLPSSNKPTTNSSPTLMSTAGLSLAFLHARARLAQGLTKDDAGISDDAKPTFVLSKPWQRGCACEVRGELKWVRGG